jgi:predicted nucleotidyltransferase
MSPHKLHLLPRHLHMVQEILRQHLPNAHVWAYGSRVHGNHHDASDLDLVVRQPDNMSQAQTQLARVSEVFADSNLPLIIELVLRFTKTLTNKIDGFIFQFRLKPQRYP